MLVLLALAAVANLRTAASLECPLTPRNVSCSDQMPHLNLSKEDCIVEYYLRNSSECAALDLRGESWSRRLGAVRMRPYVWTDDEGTAVTAFNLSFLDVRWTCLVLRFSSLGDAPPTNFCRGLRLSRRALHLSGDRPPRLHFHCPWCGYDCELRPFSLEYVASAADGRHPDEYGRFLFTMPQHNYVGEPGVPFPYVEASSPATAHVRWPPPPPPPDGAAWYSVATLVDGRRTAEQTVAAAQASLAVALGAAEAAAAGAGGGAVSFSVRALLPNCSLRLCSDVRTPPLAWERSTNASYLWAAAGVVAVAGAILLTGCVLWRRGSKECPSSKQVGEATTVLLVYRHTSDGHAAVMRQLAAYLRAAGDFRVLLDEEDIPRCADKDPLAWYTEALVRADVALVVASPAPGPAPGSTPASAGVYGAAAAAAESLLGARLSRGGRCEALSLPGRPHLPPPARGLRLLRARRPSHLCRLVRRLHAGGGGRGSEARSAPSRAAARALLQLAQDTAEEAACHQQVPPVLVDDDSSGFPETQRPVFSSDSPVHHMKRQQLSPTAAPSSIVDLQKMNLLGPDLSEEDIQEDEGDSRLRDIHVSTWTSARDPDTISLQL